MLRKCSDWLASYEEYVSNTESPKEYHRWVALSMVSSVLRKKVHFGLGRIPIFPNVYCILVGPPGARKSEAIKFGQQLLQKIPDIHTSSDATTPEAFIQDIANSVTIEQMPDGKVFTHCSLSIISRELEIFLGNKQSNHKMLAHLTDLFDAPEDDWKYRTKHGKSDVIPSVYINLLAATTPDSLASSLPLGAVGSGFTSRIMFIYASKRKKKIPIPEVDSTTDALKKALVEDLYTMSRIAGKYVFSPEAKEFWITWYEQYDEHDPHRLCQEPSFVYWYERKPIQILKVAQLIAATSSNELVITERHLVQAIQFIEETEPTMGKAFASVGRSTITTEVEMVLGIIEMEGIITEPALTSRLLKEMDSTTFDNVIKTITRTGKVRRHFGKPGQADAFEWIGDIQ